MFEVNLFGKDKGGKYKVWSIEVREYLDPVSQRDTVSLSIRHGQEGGKITLKQEFDPVGKQGRTSYEQALLEAEARVKKQMDKGYRENKAELEELPVLPMLAGDYNKIGHRINYEKGVYLSDKLDGVRLMAKCLKDGAIVLQSRTGQPYDIPHIAEELKGIMQPGDILDGEAYLHGYVLQDIASAVKRTDTLKEVKKLQVKLRKYQVKNNIICGGSVPDPEEYDAILVALDEAVVIHELRQNLQFIVFSVIESDTVSQDMPFSEVVLETIFYKATRSPDSSYIRFIEYNVAMSEEEMKEAHKDSVSRGYEGIMIRNSDGVNESGKRSADLQKYKEFVDAEFLILDVLPAKDEGSVYLLKNDLNDRTFTCTLGSMSDRAKALEEKSERCGKYMTAQFQSRYKNTLLPQFPTGKLIREGEVVDGQFVPQD
ncbi:putative DNA ligase [Pseudomonas phage vB_PF_Y1-MI]|nr:putative DNA ligase [Pseudomonas phage vB_PF_Y1-MI]